MNAFFAVTLLAIGGIAGIPAWAEANSGPAPAQEDAASARYPTDGPLREGMRNIRAAVEGLGRYEAGGASEKDAVRLAGEIEQNVRFIIANCKLAPEADAALHAIIVPLMQNAGTLRNAPTRRDAIVAMRRALRDYERQFDDTTGPKA